MAKPRTVYLTLLSIGIVTAILGVGFVWNSYPVIGDTFIAVGVTLLSTATIKLATKARV